VRRSGESRCRWTVPPRCDPGHRLPSEPACPRGSLGGRAQQARDRTTASA